MSDYSASGASDEEILEAQLSSRKRRKLSPDESGISVSKTSAPTTSRVKPKGREALPVPARVSKAADLPIQDVKKKSNFASVDVAPWLVASLASMEIKRPTGIQAACIPEILKGRDCIGGSRTGTGKTVAFAVPILQKWAEDPCGIFALIIT
jgi:ATP-dependent RNA helicase DDX49/DBP8